MVELLPSTWPFLPHSFPIGFGTMPHHLDRYPTCVRWAFWRPRNGRHWHPAGWVGNWGGTMTPAQKAELASVLAGIEEMKIRPNSTCIPFFLAWACYQIKFQIFVSQRGRITCATRPSQAPCFNRGFQAWNVPWRMLLGLHASGVDWKAVACFTVLCHYRNPALWDVKYSCNFMHAYIYILLLSLLLLLYIYILYTHIDVDVFKKWLPNECTKPYFFFDA